MNTKAQKYKRQSKLLLIKIKAIADTFCYWYETPLENTTKNSEIVFEWFNGNKKLTIYIGNTIDCLQILNINPQSIVEKILDLNNYQQLKEIWEWITD